MFFPHANGRLSNNGCIGFNAPGAGIGFTNGPIPNPSAFGGHQTLFGYWDDLYPAPGGNVYIGSVGSAPNRAFIAQWQNVYHFDSRGNPLRFEIQIFESPQANGVWAQYIYTDLDVGNASFNNAASASIGYQSSGTNGVQYSFNQPGYAAAGTVISVLSPVDCDGNGVPDLCELAGHDCNTNGMLDSCDIANGAADCDGNATPDECDIRPHAVVVNSVPAVIGYVDISAFGAPQNLGDDQVVDVTMPFTNSFYPSGAGRLSNNGALGFNAPGTEIGFTNGPIPNGGAFGGAQTLFPYWDDLYPAAGGNVYVATVGVAPRRTFIVEWHDIQHFSSSPSTVRFELQVFETPDAGGPVAQFLYQDVDFGNGNNNGASASIGYQLNGSRGFQYAFDQSGSVTAGTVLSVMPLDCNNNNLLDICEPSGPILVPAEFATIQAAINASSACRNLVLVSPGTYNEQISFGGRVVTVRSTNGPTATTINGGGAGSVVSCVFTGEGPGTVLDGFTLTGGTGFPSGGTTFGGGIVIASASPTFINCVIASNTAALGGGVYTQDSSAILDRCTFRNNNGTLAGGGVFSHVSSNLSMRFCRFDSNAAPQGAGAYWNSSSTGTLESCVFVGNAAQAYGGGLQVDSSHPVVANCLFAGNSASIRGSAIVEVGTSGTLWRNCTMAGGAGNAAIYAYNSATILANCIVWGNAGGSLSTDAGGTIAATYSDIQGGLGGAGNLNVDPRFVNPGASDYRLADTSPCIDAGDNAAVPPDVLDLDGDFNTAEPLPVDVVGNARFRDDVHSCDRGSGTPPLVDMGAFEFQLTSPPLGDMNCDLAVNSLDVAPFALALVNPAAYATAFPGCNINRGDMNCDGSTDALDIQSMVNCLLSGACP